MKKVGVNKHFRARLNLYAHGMLVLYCVVLRIIVVTNGYVKPVGFMRT